MKKKFENVETLDAWIKEKFPPPKEWTWEINIVDEAEIEALLVSEGYDLDDLVSDGHDYNINGHTNNGWLYEDEIALDYIDDLKAQGRVRKR